MENLKIFLKKSSFVDHYNLYKNSLKEYIMTVFDLVEKNIPITSSNLSKALTISLQDNNKELAKQLLLTNCYGLYEILLTCETLDSNRYEKQLKKKLTKNLKQSKINVIKTELLRMSILNEGHKFSLSNSKIKFLKKNWLNLLSKKDLSFYALVYPKKRWKKLINLLHPKSDDFQLSWFMSFICENKIESGSIVDICGNLTNDNILEVIKKYKPDYKFLRKLNHIEFTDEIIEEVCKYTPIDVIMWHWGELNNDYVNKYLIKNKGNLKIPYGKLVEQLIQFKEYGVQNIYDEFLGLAENKLKKYDIKLKEPVVVLGDASQSMQVAIKTSSIISSILSVVCSAELRLFNETDIPVENRKNVNDVIDLGINCLADGTTCPVASLHHYYKYKKIIKTIIVVTDEMENVSIILENNKIKETKWLYENEMEDNEYDFAKLFDLYRKEVYKSKIVFITFTESNKDCFMVDRLKQVIGKDIERDLLKFTMNLNKPNLTKLDYILETLSLYITFEDTIEKLDDVKAEKIQSIFI